MVFCDITFTYRAHEVSAYSTSGFASVTTAPFTPATSATVDLLLATCMSSHEYGGICLPEDRLQYRIYDNNCKEVASCGFWFLELSIINN